MKQYRDPKGKVVFDPRFTVFLFFWYLVSVGHRLLWPGPCSARTDTCVPALIPMHLRRKTHSPSKANGPWSASSIPRPRSPVLSPGTLALTGGQSPRSFESLEDEIPIILSHSSEDPPPTSNTSAYWTDHDRVVGTCQSVLRAIHPTVLYSFIHSPGEGRTKR